MTSRSEFCPDRWWRVIAPDDTLWCETSNEAEARRAMRPGDTLERLYTRTDHEWRQVLPDAADELDAAADFFPDPAVKARLHQRARELRGQA